MPYQRDPYRQPLRPTIPMGPQSAPMPTRTGSYLAKQANRAATAGDRLAQLAGIDAVDPMSRDAREADGRYMPPTGPAFNGGTAEQLSGLAAVPSQPNSPRDPIEAQQRQANAGTPYPSGGLSAPEGMTEHEPSLPQSDDYKARLLESLYRRLEEAIANGDSAARGRIVAQINAVKQGEADSRPEAEMARMPQIAPATSGLAQMSEAARETGLSALHGSGTPNDPRAMGSPGPSPEFTANPSAGTPMDPRAMGSPGGLASVPPKPTPRPAMPGPEMPEPAMASSAQPAAPSTGGLASVQPAGAQPPLPEPRPQRVPEGDTAGFGDMLMDDPEQNRHDTQEMAKAVSGADDSVSDVPEWALPLLAAGLGMMASNNPSGMAAAGEGGLAGLKSWLGMKQQAEKKRERQEDVAFREARLKQTADLAREGDDTRVRLAKLEAETMAPYRHSQIRANEALASYREGGGRPSASSVFSFEDALKEANRTANAAAKGLTGETDMSEFYKVRNQLLREYGFTPDGRQVSSGMGASTEPAADPLGIR